MLSSQPNCWQDEVFVGGEVWVLVGTGKGGGCLMAVSSRVAEKDQEIWEHTVPCHLPTQAVVSFLCTSSSFPLSQSLLFYEVGVGRMKVTQGSRGPMVFWPLCPVLGEVPCTEPVNKSMQGLQDARFRNRRSRLLV